MRGFKAGVVTLAAASGLAMIGLAPKPAYAYWEEHHRHEYKVRMVKPTKVNMVVFGKYSQQNREYPYLTLHKGQVVRILYGGTSGFDWHVMGGRYGHYGQPRYQFSAKFKSHKSFKILKIYRGVNWF